MDSLAAKSLELSLESLRAFYSWVCSASAAVSKACSTAVSPASVSAVERKGEGLKSTSMSITHTIPRAVPVPVPVGHGTVQQGLPLESIGEIENQALARNCWALEQVLQLCGLYWGLSGNETGGKMTKSTRSIRIRVITILPPAARAQTIGGPTGLDTHGDKERCSPISCLLRPYANNTTTTPAYQMLRRRGASRPKKNSTGTGVCGSASAGGGEREKRLGVPREGSCTHTHTHETPIRMT